MIETIFFIDMCLNFVKEYTPEKTMKSVNNFSGISDHYIYGEFCIDFICIIPL